ncbi:hypothetical protein KPH14_011255 [Odynerus spinipes]|uniref:Uncharacterized protein n=1 Tax=Odynerus spinipes TaxID=1348599 RepID=A0AAD9R9G3_9HYME|nr:hypothetical protein KPH14_011255 [Odynerus spinipes]
MGRNGTGPIIRMSSAGTHGAGGIECCCCRCCTCIHIEFLKTLPGIVKVCETEMMFNAVASFLYLSSASYLAFSTKVFLLPEYYLKPGFDVYPAMTAAYIMSGIVGVLHGADAYFSYVYYRTGR